MRSWRLASGRWALLVIRGSRGGTCPHARDLAPLDAQVRGRTREVRALPVTQGSGLGFAPGCVRRATRRIASHRDLWVIDIQAHEHGFGGEKAGDGQTADGAERIQRTLRRHRARTLELAGRLRANRGEDEEVQATHR